MKPRSKNVETGRRGEEVAAAWLEARGFRVVERNWRCGHKEVDLVAESERAVHIVEVKTLTPPLLSLPAEKVDARKQARLVAAARRLIAERHIDCEVQFDIVAVVLDGEEPQVEYIPEAFYPIFY
jgi:putative endonuclease